MGDGSWAKRGNELKPPPIPKAEETEGPSDLFEPVKFFRKIKSFWKTRIATLHGSAVYDYSNPQLQKLGYMGPWEFNLTQSTIAALPGTVYATLRELLFEPNVSSPVAQKFKEISDPLVIPFILMLTAYTIGRASLRKEDSTKSKRDRGSRIFLYLDGAYGFYPQLLLSSAASFGWSRIDFDAGVSIKALVPYIFSVVAAVQLLIYLVFIPEDLFNALGYRAFGLKDNRPTPPKGRYRLAILVIIPLLIFAVRFAALVLGTLLGVLVEFIRAHLHSA